MRHSPSPHRPGVLGALGRTCYRHRWLTLAAWIVGTACLVTLWMQFGAPANNNLAGNDTGQSILMPAVTVGDALAAPASEPAMTRH